MNIACDIGSVAYMCLTSLSFSLLVSTSFLTIFFLSRASCWPMTRFTAANFRVFFCTPMVPSYLL